MTLINRFVPQFKATTLFSQAIDDAISAPVGTAKKENRTTIKAMIQKGRRKKKQDEKKKKDFILVLCAFGVALRFCSRNKVH